MEKAAERVQELMARFLENRLTEPEFNEFWQLLTIHKDDILKDQLDLVWEASAHAQELPAVVWTEKMQLKKSNNASLKSVDGRRLINPQWWAAAAALIVVATGIWLFTRYSKNGDTGKPTAGNGVLPANIRPGGTRAVLTLADGSIVELDSTGHKTLARQGAIQVQEQNGQLAYNGQAAKDETVLFNVLTTPRGGKYSLVLPDGSKVWLNAASSLRYPTAFTGGDRVVELTGEAFFEIAANPAQPFKVSSQGQLVEVLGTAFNINAYPDETAIETTLLNGAVRVTAANTQPVVLMPGNQAVVSAKGIHRQEVNTDDETAWKNDLFAFNNTDFKSIMRQLSRWYDVDLEWKGPMPGKQLIGNISRNYSIEQVLKMLAFTAGIQYHTEGKKIILSLK
jgi:transmembrane sensor